MALNIDHHVHFRCVFTLVPVAGAATKWADIPYAVRRWIAKRADRNPAFQGSWFFVGGKWRPAGDRRFSVQTARHVGNGTEQAPQHWAVRYEHADDDTLARQWRTDIGLTLKADGSITFSLTTIHWLQPGFIGKEPEPPLPSAPGIVGTLLREMNWRAFAGSERLSTEPQLLREGYAHLFRDSLFDEKRKVPIVLVAKTFHTGKPLIDSSQLAHVLAGAATVYESESSLVDKELEYLLDSEYRCWNGKVRVYQPGLDPDKLGDSRRHRYFNPDDIATFGAPTIVDFLVRGIVRRSLLQTDASVANIEDVQARVQQEQLAALKASAPDNEAWIKALEADNERLNKALADSRGETQMWSAEAERLQTVDEENRVLEYRNRTLSEETASAKKHAELFETQANVLADLKGFPDSLKEVIALVEQAFPGRLLFTSRAKSDAAKCKLRDVDAGWQCLRAMATHLYRLHFDERLPLREVAKQFQNLVPFELATTESETTKNNKKLAKQRKAVYKGQERDFSPHVKFGRDPGNSLRVHYFVDSEDQILVIDRCGDHLDLKSTN